MRRKTWAYNGIVIGFLIGLWVWGLTQSTPLAVLAGIGVSIVAFLGIRFLENLIYNGAEKAEEKIREAYENRKSATAKGKTKKCKSCGAEVAYERLTCSECGALQKEKSSPKCRSCGTEIDPNSSICTNCGTRQ